MIGNIQMNREGTFFLSLHNDRRVRIFQIKNETVILFQIIEINGNQGRNVQLSYDRDFLLIFAGTKYLVYQLKNSEFSFLC
jgi:hypothetical protein